MQTLSPQEVEAMLGITRHMLKRLVHQNAIPYCELPNKDVVFLKSSIERWLKSRERNAPSELSMEEYLERLPSLEDARKELSRLVTETRTVRKVVNLIRKKTKTH